MVMMKCEACDYDLDRRGRCAFCFGVDPESIEARKYDSAFWAVCVEHGAFQPTQRPYRYSWTTLDPKDKRKKIEHHKWSYDCPQCSRRYENHPVVFRERIPRRPEIYQPEIEARLKEWNR